MNEIKRWRAILNHATKAMRQERQDLTLDKSGGALKSSLKTSSA